MRKKKACFGWSRDLFRSGSIDQNRSSANWPLPKILQRHGDAEIGFKEQAVNPVVVIETLVPEFQEPETLKFKPQTSNPKL
jgi:hypothetical protein